MNNIFHIDRLMFSSHFSKHGDNVAALESLQVALTLDKDSSPVHQAMAAVHAHLGQVTEAEGHHQMALQLSPGNAECRTNFGIFLTDTGMTVAS